ILNIPNYSDTGKTVLDRIYLASDQFGGIAYNDSNGLKSAWFYENSAVLSGSVTSLAQLSGKEVIAFDDLSRRLWIKDNIKAIWNEQGAAGLPAAGSGRMFIINQKD